MSNLMPFDQACLPRPPEQQSESYAENLHHSLENEISTPEGAAQFLETTYPTEAMLRGATEIFDRLTRGNASPSLSIYRFNSQFGGGKTHTLIALAAMALHPQAAGMSESAFRAISVPHGIKLVTFSGDEANPISGQNLPGSSIAARSLTGVLAYRLGGAALLERYRQEDELLTSAGTQAYREMIGREPVLILIDELANYVAKAVAAQVDSVRNIRSLLFDLIEAVKACPRAALVITSPDRNADAFREATGLVTEIINETRDIVGRNVSDITPTAPSDLAPILRRRLFQGCDEEAKQRTVNAYRELFALHYPAQALDLTRQVAESYPFHPLLLELINTRLAENDSFQKVRGTLRLLASMVAANSGGDALLLHPHHIDPGASYFTNEMNSRLEQGGFTAAIQTDITGENATVGDSAQNPMPKYVATTILLGSLAPSARRGLTEDFVTRSILSPDHSDPGVVRDAIASIRSRAIYINTDTNDLQFSTTPNIRNEVDQKKREIQRDPDRVENFVKQLLQVHFAPNSANSRMGVLIFPGAGDIPDSAHQTQLAIINPRFCNQQSPTRIDDLRSLFNSSNSLASGSTRQNRNNIVILLAKSNNWPNLQDQVVTQIAAKSIQDSPPQGTSEANLAEVSEIINRADTLIGQEIRTHWSELYFPSVQDQITDGLPLRHISMPAGTVNRDGQQDVIDHLTTSNKIPNPAIPMVASNYWTSIAALRDASDPPTLRKVQEEIARTPRLLMALNYNALREMVGLAVQRNELVIHSAQGMLIADAALMRDDAVIYIAGNEPSVPPPPLPPLPDEDESHDAQPPTSTPGPSTDRETGFDETGARANQVVANLDAFMARHKYVASDIEDITIATVGEPTLNYLAGVFAGIDAEFAYRSAGNGYEVQVTASDDEYTRDRRYWVQFSHITGDEGESTMRARPSSPKHGDMLQTRLRQLDGQHIIDLKVNFRAETSL